MYYVFEKSDGAKILTSGICFEHSGYYGKMVFKGSFEECLEFIK